MEVIIKNVRLAFPAIYEPRAMANDPASHAAYGAKLIVDPKSPAAKTLSETLLKVAQEKWSDKGEAILKKLIADKKVCYVEGPYLDREGEPRDGFKDSYYLSCRNEKLKPAIKDKYNRDIGEGSPGAPYSGCYVHAAVDVWAQDDKTWGRRLNCSLQGVMFASDGESFAGGRPASDDTFSELAADASDEAFV